MTDKTEENTPRPSPRASGPLPAGGIRLQKIIAGTGLASRRKAEALIAAGRVTVNGKVVTELGTKVDPDRVHIKVDGKHLSSTQPYVYLLLNKPKNVMSTLNDPGGRPTVKDYLRGISVRVFPVGRLDFDSEGLMLLTNHGDLALGGTKLTLFHGGSFAEHSIARRCRWESRVYKVVVPGGSTH